MDENKKEEKQKELTERKDPKSKKEKANVFVAQYKALKQWVIDVAAEFKKVTWPSRQQVIKDTTTVIVTGAIFGVVICVMDIAFSWLYRQYTGFFGSKI